jgi:hypothetical protein
VPVGGSASRSSLRREGRAEGSERRDGCRAGGFGVARGGRRGRDRAGSGAACGDGGRGPGRGLERAESDAAAHKGETQGERCDGRRAGWSWGTAKAEDARGEGPVRVGRCEYGASRRAHVVRRRCVVKEVCDWCARAR